MIQLSNGWIVAAYSFMPHNDDAVADPAIYSGIGVKISKDNGYTWSDEIVACRGYNLDPSLIELPPGPGKRQGEIQLFYTETYRADNSDDFDTYQSSVAMIRSNDGGYTWSPVVDGLSGRGIKIAQSGWRDGNPSAVVLKDGKGIALVCETWNFNTNDLSKQADAPWVVWSSLEQNWDYNDFDGEGYGPWARRWKVRESSTQVSPYVIQMETGETLVALSYPGSWGFMVHVGDSDA